MRALEAELPANLNRRRVAQLIWRPAVIGLPRSQLSQRFAVSF
jgi:hypothetical protein